MQKRLKSQKWPKWGQFPFILPMNLLCSHCLLFDISLKVSKTLELLISPKRILFLSFSLSLSLSVCLSLCVKQERRDEVVGWMAIPAVSPLAATRWR